MYSASRQMSPVEKRFIRSVIQVSAVVGEPAHLAITQYQQQRVSSTNFIAIRFFSALHQ
jgi:hypothetical protein